MDWTENMCYTARNRQTSDKISLYSNINIFLYNSYNSGVSIVLSWLRKLLFKLLFYSYFFLFEFFFQFWKLLYVFIVHQAL